MAITSVFVYGTLKRGQVRQSLWPHPPIDVRPATTAGALYDLGPYPAMVEGDDLVAGELWSFEPGHIAATLARLDQIEGFNQGGEDLYVRREVECRVDNGEVVTAFTYHFANASRLPQQQRIAEDANGMAAWPANADDGLHEC